MSNANYLQVTGPGICFAHGPFRGAECPKLPACVSDPPQAEYMALASKTYSIADAKEDTLNECCEVVSGLAGKPSENDPMRRVWDAMQSPPGANVLNRLCELLEDDPITLRTFWSLHFPEKELERFANDRGYSFD